MNQELPKNLVVLGGSSGGLVLVEKVNEPLDAIRKPMKVAL